jgi:hypothetical protein
MVKITKKQFSQGTRYDFSINGHTYTSCLCLHDSLGTNGFPVS